MASNQPPIQWALRVTSLGKKCLDLAAQQTPKLNTRPAYIGFMVDKVPEGQLSLWVLCFPPPLSLHQSSTLSHSKYQCNLQLKLSLNTHLHIWMSGVILLLLPYAFITWKGATLPLKFFSTPCQYRSFLLGKEKCCYWLPFVSKPSKTHLFVTHHR